MKAKLRIFKPRGKWYTDDEIDVDGTKPLHEVWEEITAYMQQRWWRPDDYLWTAIVSVPEHVHDHPHMIVHPRISAAIKEIEK